MLRSIHFFVALFAAFSMIAAPSATVSTIAGTPNVAGFENGPASIAKFNRPTWIDVQQSTGDIFVVDRANDAVRRISKGFVGTYLASPAVPSYLPSFALDFGGPFGGGILVEPRGAGCGSGIYDSGIFIVSSGAQQIALFAQGEPFPASRDDFWPIIGKLNEPGAVDGDELGVRFNNPTGIARDWFYPNFDSVRNRSIYVADTGNHTIRRFAFRLSFEACPQAKSILTLAGAAGEAGSRDGAAREARFNSPRGVAAGKDGSVYVADSGNHTIRKISPNGIVTTIAGVAGVPGNDGAHLNTPSGIDVNADGELFIADTGNATVRMLTKDGQLVTIAGVPNVAGYVDGPGYQALFSGPVGLRLAPDGSIIVADPGNETIRRIVLDRDEAPGKKRRIARP